MPVLALTSAQLLAFTLAALVLVAFIVVLAMVSKGRRRAPGSPDIPAAMQPGPSDPDLEKPRLERLQGWGGAFILLFVVWIPLVWLREPANNEAQEAALKTQSIARGAQSVQLFTEDNQLGVGCVRCHGDNPTLGGGQNLYNNILVQVPDLRNVCGGPNTGHAAIHNLNDVQTTIMEGRPGTDMPSWSVRFQGALDDQQIQDILNYIISINQKEVPFNQNVCINPKAKGYVAPVVPAS